jgi:branched-chain amino acid transport system permease protein
MIDYIVSVATEGVIFALFVLGLNVPWGWAGDLDIAYYTFIAIGAYTDAVLTLPNASLRPGITYILGLNLPFAVGALAAMVVAGLCALLVGAVALRRLRGDYFSITTLATALIVLSFVSLEDWVVGGYTGVYGVREPFNAVLHLGPHVYPLFYLALCLVVLGAVYLVLEMLYRSPFGRALRSVREDEVAATAFGRNIYALKLKGYVIGGIVAGLGGALFVHFLGAFNTSAWQPFETLFLYGAIFMGGMGNNRGVIVGVFLSLIIINEITRFLPLFPGNPYAAPAIREIMVGVLILVVLRWRPQGLLQEPRPKDSAFAASAPVHLGSGAARAPRVPATVRPPAPRGAEAVAPALLDVRGLEKSYGGVRAVRGCSFVVPENAITGLIGPNGAGKSTVIDLITGFQPLDAGVVRFAGEEIQGWPAFRLARRGLMRTFQMPREWPRLTVMDNMLLAEPDEGRAELWRALLARRYLRTVEGADRVQAREILGEFGLLDLRDELAGNLSGGQKRLLELARIFIAKPRLVLLDEPLTGVNPVLGERIGHGIKSLVAQGTTVLMVEHNLPFVERMCSTVIVMALGCVIATGALDELRTNPTVVDAYLGQAPSQVIAGA